MSGLSKAHWISFSVNCETSLHIRTIVYYRSLSRIKSEEFARVGTIWPIHLFIHNTSEICQRRWVHLMGGPTNRPQKANKPKLYLKIEWIQEQEVDRCNAPYATNQHDNQNNLVMHWNWISDSKFIIWMDKLLFLLFFATQYVLRVLKESIHLYYSSYHFSFVLHHVLSR